MTVGWSYVRCTYPVGDDTVFEWWGGRDWTHHFTRALPFRTEDAEKLAAKLTSEKRDGNPRFDITAVDANIAAQDASAA